MDNPTHSGQSLVSYSGQIYTAANQILRDTKALEIFATIGKVEVIGSLRLKLMYRRDIDFLVISEVIEKRKAEAVTNTLTDSGFFTSVTLKDYQSNPEYDMPLGYYWELLYKKDGHEWKFDVWYLKPEERYTKLVLPAVVKFENILDKDPEKGEIILKLKEHYFDGIKYRDGIKSIDIYTAVLEDGINSVEQFEAQKDRLVRSY
jgi:hypothetical protein